jgi:hypothetical protein
MSRKQFEASVQISLCLLQKGRNFMKLLLQPQFTSVERIESVLRSVIFCHAKCNFYNVTCNIRLNPFKISVNCGLLPYC